MTPANRVVIPMKLPSAANLREHWAAKASRVKAQRGIVTMFRQILAGLEALDTEYAFCVEHDVLYHPSHFQ